MGNGKWGKAEAALEKQPKRTEPTRVVRKADKPQELAEDTG